MIGTPAVYYEVMVRLDVTAHSRQQAEAFVQAVAVTPFRHSRRGTGQIVRTAEQKEKAQ